MEAVIAEGSSKRVGSGVGSAGEKRVGCHPPKCERGSSVREVYIPLPPRLGGVLK